MRKILNNISDNQERANMVIIFGLLAIDFILWAGIFTVYLKDKDVPGELILAAAGIPTGLLSWLSRDSKTSAETTSGDINIEPQTTKATATTTTTTTKRNK